MLGESQTVTGMAFLRLLSSAIEACAALFMLRFGRVETAVQINALLAVIGPIILSAVTALGLMGLAGKVPFVRLVFIGAGVLLILYGARR
ncbi:MAG TPA: YqhV family protein [Limnochordia bacterium]